MYLVLYLVLDLVLDHSTHRRGACSDDRCCNRVRGVMAPKKAKKNADKVALNGAQIISKFYGGCTDLYLIDPEGAYAATHALGVYAHIALCTSEMWKTVQHIFLLIFTAHGMPHAGQGLCWWLWSVTWRAKRCKRRCAAHTQTKWGVV